MGRSARWRDDNGFLHYSISWELFFLFPSSLLFVWLGEFLLDLTFFLSSVKLFIFCFKFEFFLSNETSVLFEVFDKKLFSSSNSFSKQKSTDLRISLFPFDLFFLTSIPAFLSDCLLKKLNSWSLSKFVGVDDKCGGLLRKCLLTIIYH